MPIYSGNRYFNVGGITMEANKAYYNATAGRILNEAIINDQNLFAAMYYNDMNEMSALSEGTLLEAEKKSEKKNIFQTIKDAIVSFYKKILAFIDAAIVKIFGVLSKMGSKRLKQYENAIKNNAADLNKIKLNGFKNSKKTTMAFDAIQKYLVREDDAQMHVEDRQVNTDNVISEIVRKSINGASVDGEITVEKVKEAFFEKASNTTVGKAVFTADGKTGVDGLIAACSAEKSVTIKEMKIKRKEIDRLFKEHLKQLDRSAKKAGKDSEEGKKITEMRKTTTAVQGAVSKLTSGLISVAKYETARNTAVLSRVIGKLGKGKEKIDESDLSFVTRATFSEAVMYLESDISADDVEYAQDEILNVEDED